MTIQSRDGQSNKSLREREREKQRTEVIVLYDEINSGRDRAMSLGGNKTRETSEFAREFSSALRCFVAVVWR